LPYRELFVYFREEAEVSAGPEFGERILQKLGLPLDGEELTTETPAEHPVRVALGSDASGRGLLAPVVPIAREPFRLGVVAAAAAIVLIVAGLFLLPPPGQPAILASNTPAGRTTPGAGTAGSSAIDQGRSNDQGRSAGQERSNDQGRSNELAAVTDTYDDPEQALAAVRHALLIASRNLNQGRRQLIGAHK
jgi:hypothetical protein